VDGRHKPGHNDVLVPERAIIWAIAAGNAGLHFAVSPATSAYRTCVGSSDANLDDCKRKLHQDWSLCSGYRVTYAALAGLAPVLIGWLIAYALVASGRRRHWDHKQRRV